MKNRIKMPKKLIIQIPVSMAWFFTFAPALWYFITTRVPSLSPLRLLQPFLGGNEQFVFSSSRHVEYGTKITNYIELFEEYSFDALLHITATTPTAKDASTSNSDSNGAKIAAATANNRMLHSYCNKLMHLFYWKATTVQQKWKGLCNSRGTTSTITKQQPTSAIRRYYELHSSVQHIYTIGRTTTASNDNGSRINNNVNYVMDMVYRYDSVMGRGYVLYTTSMTNRIWRYEIGSGLITIGKTLFMDHACCRSYHHNNCSISSAITSSFCGPLTIEYDHKTINSKITNQYQQTMEGKLLIAEYGEKRIVRYEEEYGTRTPIVMSIPCTSDWGVDMTKTMNCSMQPSDNFMRTTNVCETRLPNPHRMMYTPYGDLLLVVNHSPSHVRQQDKDEMKDGAIDSVCQIPEANCEPNGNTESIVSVAEDVETTESSTSIGKAALIMVPKIGQIKSLTTLQQSREAHYWDNHIHPKEQKITESPHLHYNNPKNKLIWMGGIALSSNAKMLYGCGKIRSDNGSFSYNIFQTNIYDDVDDEDDGSNDEAPDGYKRHTEMKFIFDLRNYTTSKHFIYQEDDHHHHTNCAAMVIGQSGIIYITVFDGILLFDPDIGQVIAKIPILSSTTIAANETIESVVVPTALTFSDDGYLYIAATSIVVTHHDSSLYRIRTKDRPVSYVIQSFS